MEKVYKSIMGYKPSDEKHEQTHYILTVAEYDELRQQIRDAEAQARQARSDAAAAQQSAERYKAQVDREAEQSIADMELKLEVAEKLFQDEVDLNANLIRIAKERANAERGLTPKKQHPGYAVLSTQPTKYMYHDRKKKVLECWKTLLQSPYDATLPFVSVEAQTRKDFVDYLGAYISVETMYDGINDYVEHVKDIASDPENVIFDIQYKANFKARYWEITCFHTKQISVREELRLPPKKKNHKNNQKFPKTS